MHLTIVSGLSGAGKSVALHTLEDDGFYCIDNLPGGMLPELVNRFMDSSNRHFDNLAVGIDARSDFTSIESFMEDVSKLRDKPGLKVGILFLETNREILIKRFSETRRKHPLSSAETPLVEAIEQESSLLSAIRDKADFVIDSSALNLHQLRDIIRDQLVARKHVGPAIQFRSFGFKNGAPRNSDFVFDARCLPNPHWDPTLRALTGLDQPVVEFLQQNKIVDKMFSDIKHFLESWLPVFQAENRAYLTVSIGCTGGQHRSVYLAERLAAHFTDHAGTVSVSHRELT